MCHDRAGRSHDETDRQEPYSCAAWYDPQNENVIIHDMDIVKMGPSDLLCYKL